MLSPHDFEMSTQAAPGDGNFNLSTAQMPTERHAHPLDLWYVACHAFELHAVQYTTSTCVHPMPSHAPLPCLHQGLHCVSRSAEGPTGDRCGITTGDLYSCWPHKPARSRAEPDSRPLRPRPPRTSVGPLSLRPCKQQHCLCSFTVENIRLTLVPYPWAHGCTRYKVLEHWMPRHRGPLILYTRTKAMCDAPSRAAWSSHRLAATAGLSS